MLIVFRRAGRLVGHSRFAALALTLLLIAAPLSSGAMAADINVLTVRAFKPLLLDIARTFQGATGNTLTIASHRSDGGTARVLRGGEEMHLVVLPAEAMFSLANQGKIMADTMA